MSLFVETTRRAVWSFVRDESAPTMVEYGLLLIFIAVVTAVAVTFFGKAVVANLFETSNIIIDSLT